MRQAIRLREQKKAAAAGKEAARLLSLAAAKAFKYVSVANNTQIDIYVVNFPERDWHTTTC